MDAMQATFVWTGRYPFGWEELCRRNDHNPKSGLYLKFFFCLDIDAKVFRIETRDDFNALPKVAIANDAPATATEFIDFEECLRQGIDAIVYAYTEVHCDEELRDEMDVKMMGWDCDSILILNPNVILKKVF